MPIPVPPIDVTYAELQKNQKTATYDVYEQGLTAVTIAPPVQMSHPIFQEFLDRIDDPAFQPDQEVISPFPA